MSGADTAAFNPTNSLSVKSWIFFLFDNKMSPIAMMTYWGQDNMFGGKEGPLVFGHLYCLLQGVILLLFVSLKSYVYKAVTPEIIVLSIPSRVICEVTFLGCAFPFIK